jgi:hypothetical protein
MVADPRTSELIRSNDEFRAVLILAENEIRN